MHRGGHHTVRCGGYSAAVLDLVFSDHTIAICDQIAQEVRTIMVRKFAWKEEEVLAILSEYSSDGVSVAITGTVHGVCRDPKDDMVFECAVKSHPTSSSPVTKIFRK